MNCVNGIHDEDQHRKNRKCFLFQSSIYSWKWDIVYLPHNRLRNSIIGILFEINGFGRLTKKKTVSSPFGWGQQINFDYLKLFQFGRKNWFKRWRFGCEPKSTLSFNHFFRNFEPRTDIRWRAFLQSRSDLTDLFVYFWWSQFM